MHVDDEESNCKYDGEIQKKNDPSQAKRQDVCIFMVSRLISAYSIATSTGAETL